MNRVSVYLSALAGAVALTGFASAQAPAGAAPARPAGGPPVAVFNIVEVIREYKRAKYEMYTLNKVRGDMSKNLLAMRNDYMKMQTDIQVAQQAGDKGKVDQLTQALVKLSREVQDEDAKITKMVNEKGGKVVADVYDEIQFAVDKIAEVNGYHVVFAYPDFTSPEEKGRPDIKEMKLRPPAAMPFYVAPQVDITKPVISYLNQWKPSQDVPKDATTGVPATGGVSPAGAITAPGQRPVGQ